MEFSKEDSLKCKGFAILIMLFHHMYMSQDRYAGHAIDFAPLTEGIVNNVADFFKLCVGIYVFISAYGLTASYQNWDAGNSRFILRRLLKMMIPYYFIYILMIVVSLFLGKDWNVLAAYGGESILPTIWYMLVDFLGLAFLFGTRSFCATWWYMSFAVVLVCLIPIINKLYDRVGGVCTLFIAVLLPKALGLSINEFTRWFLIMMLGVICARHNIIGKWKEALSQQNQLKKSAVFAACFLSLMICFLLRESAVKAPFIIIWDGISPYLVIVLLCLFVNKWAVTSKVFVFVGKYSTIIFLTHTMIRHYWYRDFIYQWKSVWLCYLVLLAVSLLVAITIDYLMKWIQLKKIENYVCKRLLKFES